MKKKILLIIVALLFCVTGCGTDNKETTYHEVTIDQLNQKIANKENFILMIGSSTCSACATYKVSLDAVIAKYNVYVNYINVEDLKDEEKAKLLAAVYYNSTPTTVYFTDGIASDTHNRIIGAASYDDIVADFKFNGYIGK